MADLSSLANLLGHVTVAIATLSEALSTGIASKWPQFEVFTHMIDGVAGLGKG